MAEAIKADVYVLVDSAGDYAVASSRDDAVERYEETVQALTDADGFRLVCLVVEVPLPAAVDVAVSVPVLGEPSVEVKA